MASDADTIQAAIVANVAKPKKVKTSTAEFEQHDLSEQIAAQKHVASQDAAADNPFFGLRVRKARFRCRD